MGYYVHIRESSLLIKKQDFDKAFERACDLNKHDGLKGGGSFGSDHENRWFSWVTPNYHETCKTLADVFEEFRLEPSYDDDGNINGFSFDSKIGDEDVLLAYLSPFIQDGYIEWQGEEGEIWRYVFRGGNMMVARPVISFPELTEFVKTEFRMKDGKVVPVHFTFDYDNDTFVEKTARVTA